MHLLINTKHEKVVMQHFVEPFCIAKRLTFTYVKPGCGNNVIGQFTALVDLKDDKSDKNKVFDI